METYKKALGLNQRDCTTILKIFNILSSRNDPEGVMDLIEVHGPKEAGFLSSWPLRRDVVSWDCILGRLQNWKARIG